MVGTEVLLRDQAALDAGLAAASRESRAVTDASGRFRFDHLPGGLHRLSAGPAAAILAEVEAPLQPSDRDLGDLKLAPAAAAMPSRPSRQLSVTNLLSDPPEPPLGPGRAVSGRITDPQGSPVASADLLLHSFAAGS